MKRCSNVRYSTVELRKDIEEMEKEKEIVAKRIERMQRKARIKVANLGTTFRA